MENEKTPIRFQIGEETKHVIETINGNSIETSLFSEQYKKALSSLNSLLTIVSKSSITEADNTPNNILSFIGDRGSGKTSCMMTFAKLLEGGLDKKLQGTYPQVAKHAYCRIERIDPTFFDESHNVIELFLAGLYNVFRDHRDKYCGKSDALKAAEERNVVELFAQAQEMMFEMTKTEKERYDVLDNLHNLSAGVRLWSVIGKLVDAFFKFADKENGKLVLPIDDIDLNSKMAADMMEQIRKFLIQPNIIILFAVKLDQLELSKRLSLAKEYEIMFRHGLLGKSNVISEMAEAYITKLLPHQQRIYMPDGTAYFYQPVEIVWTEKYKEKDQEKKKEPIDRYESVRQMIPELIFKKTRYLFYNSSHKTSYIVPANLRELRFLIGLLYNMKDYWQDGDNHESNLYNKLLFRKYLFENWVTNNLDETMRANAQEIIHTQDNAQVNAIVLAAIKRHFFADQNLLAKFINTHSEAEKIFEETNISYNIAIGDVLDIVDFLEESERDTLKLKFLFLIRSFYSIRLYQAYDQIPEKESNKTDTTSSVESSTRLSDLHLSEYDKLVAGYFINTRLSRIIPPGRAGKDTRDERRINFEKLQSLINRVIKEGGSDTDRLCLVEFFLLGISRRYDTQNDNKSLFYRTFFPVFYAERLERIYKNAYFDVGALLYNLTRIERCYGRFRDGDKIFALAEKNQGSLFNKFRMYAIQEKADANIPREISNFKSAYWNSCSCFRNGEIIKAFRSHAEGTESSGGDHMKVMANAFNHMGGFHIPTYDKLDNGNYYVIKFNYLKEIGTLLGKESIKADFMGVFDTDYRPEPETIDIEKIMYKAYEKKNKIETRIKMIYDNYPVISENYRDVIEQNIPKGVAHVMKKDLQEMLNKINSALDKYRTR